MTRVRVGLIGCGRIGGAVHLRVLHRMPAATLAAVADPSPAARADAARIAGADVTADPMELLGRRDIDAVVICAPSDRHSQLAIAAARAGKAVYLEKPLALSVADGRAAVAALAATGRPAAIGFNHRFHPLHQRARALLRDGAIGPVRHVVTSFCEPTAPDVMPAWKRRFETGGGVLLDLGSHQVDLAGWFLGEEVAEATATLRSEVSEHDTAELRLELGGGVAVDAFLSFRAGRCDWWRFAGERGTLVVDRYASRLELTTTASGGAVRRVRWPRAPRPWQARKALRPGWEPSYRRALRAFVAAAGGAPVELPSPEDGLRSLEAILAAEASASRALQIPALAG